MIAGTGSGLDLVPVFAGTSGTIEGSVGGQVTWFLFRRRGTGVKVFPVKIICVMNGNSDGFTFAANGGVAEESL